jgi:preprotein translocase subunit YajC
MASLILILAMLAVMWFLLIRPQRRRQAVQDRMLADLRVGDEIVTAGGLYGEIRSLGDDGAMTVEIAPGMTVRIARRAVVEVHREEIGAPQETEQTASNEPTRS